MQMKTCKTRMLNKKVPFYLKIDTSMKVNGLKIKEVGEECKFGKTDLFTKGIGKIIWLTAMAGSFILMVMSISANGKTTKQMEKVNVLIFRQVYQQLRG